MSTSHACPALLVSAPASGQGKTTVTAALARRYRRQGMRVRVFKTGADFIDPMILELASGAPVHNLDPWMCGEAQCRTLLARAASEADLILVEGVMGLFDGTPSSADLAVLFGIPVLAVIDAAAMAQTFGAVAHGLATWRTGLPFAGVFANRIGSGVHAEMLSESLVDGQPLIGALRQDEFFELPSRHLGLVQAEELPELDGMLDRLAAAIDAPPRERIPVVEFAKPAERRPGLHLAGTRIAVAQDAAFAFAYAANLDLLCEMGAELRFFSPLNDGQLPGCDALYLPGGYPELYLHELATNAGMRAAIHDHHAAGKPIVAECGGMLYLLESLTGSDGFSAAMVGLLPGRARMLSRLANLGLHLVKLNGGELRGHTFHHSRAEVALAPVTHSLPLRQHGNPEAVWQQGRVTASFLHFYFPSNPTLSATLFTA